MRHSFPLAETEKPHLNLVHIQCGAHSICVLLDTGAPVSRISINAVQRLGISHDQDTANFTQLQIGGFEWEDFAVQLDHSEDKSQQYHGRQTDGVLGTDFMNGLCWLFERPKRILHLCSPQDEFVQEWTQGANTENLRPHRLVESSGHVWAGSSYLNGHGPIHTDFDTGAQRTILTRKAGALLDPNAPRETIHLSNGGTAKNVESYRCHAQELSVAGVVFSKPLVAVCDPIFSVAPELLDIPAILLGVDVIGQNSYGFDLHNGRFWLHELK